MNTYTVLNDAVTAGITLNGVDSKGRFLDFGIDPATSQPAVARLCGKHAPTVHGSVVFQAKPHCFTLHFGQHNERRVVQLRRCRPDRDHYEAVLVLLLNVAECIEICGRTYVIACGRDTLLELHIGDAVCYRLSDGSSRMVVCRSVTQPPVVTAPKPVVPQVA